MLGVLFIISPLSPLSLLSLSLLSLSLLSLSLLSLSLLSLLSHHPHHHFTPYHPFFLGKLSPLTVTLSLFLNSHLPLPDPIIMHACMQDRTVSDDLLLEVIVFCGTTALDEKCADLLLQANVHYQLIALIRGMASY